MNEHEFRRNMQRYIAGWAITPSVVRGAGAPNVLNVARTFVERLDLRTIGRINPDGYVRKLDKWTVGLMAQLPEGARRWGLARKIINVFMVGVYLNGYFSEACGWKRFGEVLETPLDSRAANGLIDLARERNIELPRWAGVRALTQADSALYQNFASQHAGTLKIPRACLDIVLWPIQEN